MSAAAATGVITGLAYLATPYSKWAAGLDAAFVEAAKLAAKLLITGIKVYSPIVHGHPIAHFGKLDPLDHAIWLPFDQAMMEVATTLIVAHLDGWDSSAGIAHEVKYFQMYRKPVFDLDPATLLMAKRAFGEPPPAWPCVWHESRGRCAGVTCTRTLPCPGWRPADEDAAA